METRGSPGAEYPSEQQSFTGVFASSGTSKGERPVYSFGHLREFFPLLRKLNPLPRICR